MKWAVNHGWIPLDGEERECPNSETIAEDAQRNNEKTEKHTTPCRTKEQVSGENADNEQNKAGANATAFLRDLNIQSRQGENEILTHIRALREVHHRRVRFGRSNFRERLKVIDQRIRQRYGKEQVGERENYSTTKRCAEHSRSKNQKESPSGQDPHREQCARTNTREK